MGLMVDLPQLAWQHVRHAVILSRQSRREARSDLGSIVLNRDNRGGKLCIYIVHMHSQKTINGLLKGGHEIQKATLVQNMRQNQMILCGRPMSTRGAVRGAGEGEVRVSEGVLGEGVLCSTVSIRETRAQWGSACPNTQGIMRQCIRNIDKVVQSAQNTNMYT